LRIDEGTRAIEVALRKPQASGGVDVAREVVGRDARLVAAMAVALEACIAIATRESANPSLQSCDQTLSYAMRMGSELLQRLGEVGRLGHAQFPALLAQLLAYVSSSCWATRDLRFRDYGDLATPLT